MSLIRRLLRESLGVKKQYLGQCDLLRHVSKENEAKWHEMMKNRKPIPFKTLLNGVEFQSILDDEDEDPTQYIKDSLRADPETSAYVSNWGNKECMFFQTAGFEFIFI